MQLGFLRRSFFPILASLELTLLSSCTALTGPSIVEPVEARATKVPAHLEPQSIQRIAFGSCNKVHLPQPLWSKVSAEHPELFIWTGDAVYADTEDMATLSELYRQQLQQPEYAAFQTTGVPIVGVYDDHDYGENNGGKDFLQKKVSQQLFLDFIGEPKNSPRRRQEGIYTSYRFGPKGQSVKLLMLDVRYNRDTPGPQADLLGAPQWAWLERELLSPDADLVLLVSSTQVLPFEHRFEKWSNFPDAHQRLLKLIDRAPQVPILIISGDRHFAEFSREKLPSGRTIYEVTSSGLTHSYRAFEAEKNLNSLRQGPVLTRLNYGLLEIDWARGQLRVEVKDINRTAVINQKISLKK